MSGIENLKRLYQQIDGLRHKLGTTEFTIWRKTVLLHLEKCFGKESAEYEDFSKIRFFPLVLCGDDSFAKIDAYTRGIEIAKGMLGEYIRDFEEGKIMQDRKKIFIVHGHDTTLKVSVARILEQQQIEPIILHEQASNGDTLIEKIEHYGNNVDAAIVLFTPDDVGKNAVAGKDADGEVKLAPRARQNVVFEAGYFMGLLGRNRVISLVSDKTIEIPSDLAGVVYTSDIWQFKLLQELCNRGFDINYNNLKV